MRTFQLEGKNLGERHKHYNEAIKKIIDTKESIEYDNDLNSGKDDLAKFLKIDVACKNRDTQYILEVLKSEDLLLVSRAVKRSGWLISEPQYAHIINPQYLHQHLFPYMTVKARIKFLKQIRLQIKDEARAEEFYKYEQNKDSAAKWLPLCSAAFIQSNVPNNNIKNRLVKRICEKSNDTIKRIVGECSSRRGEYLTSTIFILKKDTDTYLDMVEDNSGAFYRCDMKIGKRITAFLMKTCPDRIKANLKRYIEFIHFKTFLKYLTKEDVKELLFSYAKKSDDLYALYNYDKFKQFINILPEQERFPFVNEIFIEKIHSEADEEKTSPKYGMRKFYLNIRNSFPLYQLYEFATFDVAFDKIKKLLHGDSSVDKIQLLDVLIECTRNQATNIQTLLRYYGVNYKNDEPHIKRRFISNLLSMTDFHKFDDLSWNLVNNILKPLFDDKDNSQNQTLYIFVIVYSVLHNSEVPKSVEKEFAFDSLTSYQKKLNSEERANVFNYLYGQIVTKVNAIEIKTQSEFEEAVKHQDTAMKLLCDWSKDIRDYPQILDKVKELTKIKQQNSWGTSLNSLYNRNKSWKKYLFEESLIMSPTEMVCVNVLKHDIELLVRYKYQLEILSQNDKVSLQRFLGKVRVYWPESLANQWTETYTQRLTQIDGHKATVRGVCALLPHHPLLEIIQKYSPQEPQIDWNKINEVDLSLQRLIAKNMHLGRPQPPPYAILPYARGDYLQHALPSLLAIFYNANKNNTHDYVSKLLDAPVSVQKHGIRIAFNKLSADELLKVLPDIWRATKNATIRAEVFKFTYNILSQEPSKAEEPWKLLEVFMNNLSYEEDKRIYDFLKLDKVKQVSSEVRDKFYVKSYEFLKRLIENTPETDNGHLRYCLNELAVHARELITSLPTKFVENLLNEYIEKYFLISEINNDILYVMTAYLLNAKDENVQAEMYKDILMPLIQRSLEQWNNNQSKNYYVRKNVMLLLDTFRRDLIYVSTKQLRVPVKLFTDINSQIMHLPVAENYVMLTKWKLTIDLVNMMETKRQSNAIVACKCTCTANALQNANALVEQFGDLCLLRLKEDVKSYFSCIYLLFGKCLEEVISDFGNMLIKAKVYKQMLKDAEFIEGYLTVIKELPSLTPRNKDVEPLFKEMSDIMFAHPSEEVKMHCYHKFKRFDEFY